jgi:phage tail sheath protein FI
VRQSVEELLDAEWRRGELVGATPDEAYLVRCDRTTMSQGDIDRGRLIALIGVAPLRPAEFELFRIGQWTAGAPDDDE